MSWVEQHFDRHAFDNKRPHAVSVESRISFADYGRMHIQRRAKTQERRLPTPQWAIRNDWLQILLVTYLEERFYCRPVVGTPLLERLQSARQAAIYYAPRKRALLLVWLKTFHSLVTYRLGDKRDDDVLAAFLRLPEIQGQQPITTDFAREYLAQKEIRNLEIQIQNIDTDLVLTDKGHAEIIAAVVYLYYRLGWDSVTVAEELGLKSPHVRQVLARLHATWAHSLSHLEERKGRQDAAANPTGVDVPQGDALPASTPFDTIFGAQ